AAAEVPMNLAILFFALFALQAPAGAPPAQPPSTPPAQNPGSAQEAQFAAAVDSAKKLLDTDVAAAVEALDHLAAESIETRRVRSLTDAERTVHRDLFLARANAHLQMLDNDKVEDS